MSIKKPVKTTYLSDKPPTLEQAQKIVGGHVEMIKLKNSDQMLVNEDGISLNLPQNLEATVLTGMVIRGNVIVLQDKARWLD